MPSPIYMIQIPFITINNPSMSFLVTCSSIFPLTLHIDRSVICQTLIYSISISLHATNMFCYFITVILKRFFCFFHSAT